jgi:hypothetical protein
MRIAQCAALLAIGACGTAFELAAGDAGDVGRVGADATTSGPTYDAQDERKESADAQTTAAITMIDSSGDVDAGFAGDERAIDVGAADAVDELDAEASTKDADAAPPLVCVTMAQACDPRGPWPVTCCRRTPCECCTRACQ